MPSTAPAPVRARAAASLDSQLPATSRGRAHGVLQVGLSPAPGGTERLIRDLADRLRHDVRMAVVCIDEAGAWGESLGPSGIPVTAVDRRAGFRPSLGSSFRTSR